MAGNGIDVPIGPATVEFGSENPTIFNITSGGIVFSATTNTQDVTVDQYGDAPVKRIIRGGSASVTVPFALHDLDKLAAAMPNAELITDATDPNKKKLIVKAQAGQNLLDSADKLVIKPTDPQATPNDYITIPMAGCIVDPELTYNTETARVYNVTFTAFPDITDGTLYILGDETASAS